MRLKASGRSSVALMVVLLLCRCGSTYYKQRAPNQPGYTDARLDENTFQVEFRGDDATARQKVEWSLLYRCAELTKAAGFDYFIVVDESVGAATRTGTGLHQTETKTRTESGTASPAARGIAPPTRIEVSESDYTPGDTVNTRAFFASALIKTFKGAIPSETEDGFDAAEVLEKLGPLVRQKVVR